MRISSIAPTSSRDSTPSFRRRPNTRAPLSAALVDPGKHVEDRVHPPEDTTPKKRSETWQRRSNGHEMPAHQEAIKREERAGVAAGLSSKPKGSAVQVNGSDGGGCWIWWSGLLDWVVWLTVGLALYRWQWECGVGAKALCVASRCAGVILGVPLGVASKCAPRRGLGVFRWCGFGCGFCAI